MREITYREAIREALIEEMEKDPMVFLLGEDIGIYGGAYAVTKGLLEKFGDKRVKDTPLSEAVIAGAAIGAAACGTRPIAEIMYIDFMTFCMDQMVNQAAKMRYMFGGKMKVPLVIRTQGGAGRFNAAQHSQSLEAWFVHVPGLKVVMPSTPHDAKGLLKSAVRDDNPVIFIEHKLLYNTKGQIPDGEYTIPLGKAEVKRKGEDVTIVSYSRMALLALEAADELSSCGINPEVIDLGTLSPMDIETIVGSVKKTGRVIIVEEDCKTGGVGAEILSRINEEAFDYLDAPIIRIAAKDVPLPFSPILENMAIPNKESIVEAVKRIV
jgi:pyruvate/2-oxoglutarate/acetoin dehydrogenase E1 component